MLSIHRLVYLILFAVLAVSFPASSLAAKGFTTHLTTLANTKTFTVNWLGQCLTLDRKTLRDATAMQPMSSVQFKRKGWARLGNFTKLSHLEYYTAYTMAAEDVMNFSVDSHNQTLVAGNKALWLSHHFSSEGVVDEVQQSPHLFVPELFGLVFLPLQQVQVLANQGTVEWLVQASLPVSATEQIPVTLHLFHNQQGNVQISAFNGHLSDITQHIHAAFSVFHDISDEGLASNNEQIVMVPDESTGSTGALNTMVFKEGDDETDSSGQQKCAQDYPAKPRTLAILYGGILSFCSVTLYLGLAFKF